GGLGRGSPCLAPSPPAGAAPGVEEPVMAWALMRHADVDRALRDHETFRSAQSPMVEKGLSPHLTLLFDDPPRHLRLRRLINYAFTPPRVEAHEPWTGQGTAELMEGRSPAPPGSMEREARPAPHRASARTPG